APGRLGDRDRFPAAEIQRHLHRDGHRTARAGPAGRRLHVELQRSAGVRPQADSPDGAAPRLEPARDDPELSGPLLQALTRARRPPRPAITPVPGKLELLAFYF